MTDTTVADTQPTDIAALPPADRALIVLNSTKTEVALRDLVSEAANITAVVDSAGREQAHRLGMRLKNARTTIEKTGKAAREDATAFSKAVIAEEHRLKAITEAEEKRVLSLRDEYDAKIEAEKEAKRQAEAKRVAEIREKIEGIRSLPLAMAGAGSDEIAAERDALDAFEPPESVFGEFLQDCIDAKKECILSLCDLYNRVIAQEAAVALAEAERLRLEEATRAEREALARERAAIEEEKAELARMRAEVAAMKAAASGSIAAPFEPEQEQIDESELMPVVEVTPEQAAEIFEEAEIDPAPAPVVTDFKIRMAALATADQFDAIAAKVSQCGQQMFANDLRQVAITLRAGTFDQALANADHEALIAADNLLIEASMKFIDALSEEAQAA